MSTTDDRRRKRLCRAAAIFGVIGAVIVGGFWGFGLLFEFEYSGAQIWLAVLGTMLPALGGVAISRKWPLIGGVLLVLDGLATIGLHRIVFGTMYGIERFRFNTFFFWDLPDSLPVAAPLLVSGALYIFAWRIDRFRRWGVLESCAAIFGVIGAALVGGFWSTFVFYPGGIFYLKLYLVASGSVLLALGGVALAWKWPLIGGVVLILDAYALLLCDLIYEGNLSSLLPALPLLASGILFLLSWRAGRRPPKERRSG